MRKMKNFVLREPVLLYETIEAMYQCVNGISVERRAAELLRKYGSLLSGEERERMSEIGRRLQQVTELCAEQSEDPAMQYFFGKWETESQWQNICLAKLMVYSFLDIRVTDFQESLTQTLAAAQQRFSKPYVLSEINSGGMSFRTPAAGESVPGLIAQLEQLALDEQYCWRVYKLLQDYPGAMAELTELLEPAARRIAPVLAELRPLLAPIYDGWEDYFAGHSISDLLENVTNQTVNEDEMDVYVNVSLMAVGDIMYTYDTEGEKAYRQLYLGVLLNRSFQMNRLQASEESVCGLLKVISDRSKFDILRRISCRSTYCQELSREMGLTTATISRHMSLLLDAGLVRARREDNRIYYELERETLDRLFSAAKTILLSE